MMGFLKKWREGRKAKRRKEVQDTEAKEVIEHWQENIDKRIEQVLEDKAKLWGRAS